MLIWFRSQIAGVWPAHLCGVLPNVCALSSTLDVNLVQVLPDEGFKTYFQTYISYGVFPWHGFDSSGTNLGTGALWLLQTMVSKHTHLWRSSVHGLVPADGGIETYDN